jgi:hypothetical protein
VPVREDLSAAHQVWIEIENTDGKREKASLAGHRE